MPGEAFDFQKSELVQWLMNNENAFDLVFSALQSSGAIVFDFGDWLMEGLGHAMKTTHVLKLNCGITHARLHFDEETADMDALGTQGATDRIDGGSRVFTASALML